MVPRQRPFLRKKRRVEPTLVRWAMELFIKVRVFACSHP
ncbi:unnamed protein product [Larinioides sclopetarius]|uniref:Uncharacterized protein n=1 Tax=Larinioides sclopetarius TaxID=280406 RepID=A0AAV2AX99_9ARAC